jgi:uncharacterized membrane protein YecN with MAPEG domain
LRCRQPVQPIEDALGSCHAGDTLVCPSSVGFTGKRRLGRIHFHFDEKGNGMNLTVAHVLALLAMLLTVLSLNVSRLRLKYGVSYGADGHRELTVAIRAHGNALEQSLLFAVLMLALQSQSTGEAALLAWLGAVFVLARVMHPLAMFQRWLRLRQLAHVISLLAQLSAAGMLLR